MYDSMVSSHLSNDLRLQKSKAIGQWLDVYLFFHMLFKIFIVDTTTDVPHTSPQHAYLNKNDATQWRTLIYVQHIPENCYIDSLDDKKWQP